jgi:hypothetical protein
MPRAKLRLVVIYQIRYLTIKIQIGTNVHHYMASTNAALFRATTPRITDFRRDPNQ